MELVQLDLHEHVHHTGPAAPARASARSAKVRPIVGRSLGVISILLVARDILRDAGALQPEFNIAEREVYHFSCEDGSLFVVHPPWLWLSPKLVFVAGPRDGETLEISVTEFSHLKDQAETKWGKYIPGSLVSGPRFIPGTERKQLPLIREEDEAVIGWIDEEGVHYFQRIPGLRT